MKDSENTDFSKDFSSEIRTKRLNTYRNIIIGGLIIPGIALALFTYYISFSIKYSISTINVFYGFLILTLLTFSISIPLLLRINSEYRKGELPPPDELEHDTEVYRKANQCKICQRHPVSKKYHMKSVHNLKKIQINDYFVDCGCLKCAILSKPNYGVGG